MNRLIILLTCLLGPVAMASDIEEPEWELIETFGKVEVRHYPPSIQAVTELESSARSSQGFRRLAGYIFGGNEQSKSIAMTAPVQETLERDRPVMAFTMPAEYTLEDLPRPDDQRVDIIPVPARTLAAVRFSGWATRSRVSSMQRKLLSTLEQNAVEMVGVPVLNQYNPPWTPPFLRRNEIVIEVRMTGQPVRDVDNALDGPLSVGLLNLDDRN